jgi:DnaK suppressor protein
MPLMTTFASQITPPSFASHHAIPVHAPRSSARSNGSAALITSDAMPKALAAKAYLCPEQLAWFKSRLEAKIDALAAQVQTIQQYLREDSQDPDDEVGRATREEELARARGHDLRCGREIIACRAALRRMETGDYGFCASTGEEIGIPRLQAVPEALYCIWAQERTERAASLRAQPVAFS